MKLVLFLIIDKWKIVSIHQLEKYLQKPLLNKWWKKNKAKYKNYCYALCLKNQRKLLKKKGVEKNANY